MSTISNMTPSVTTVSRTQNTHGKSSHSSTQSITSPCTTQSASNARPVALPHVQNREELQKKGVIDEHAIITSNQYEKLGTIPHVSDRSHEEELLALSIPLIHRDGTQIACLTGKQLSEKFLQHLPIASFWKGKNVPYVCNTQDLFFKGLNLCGLDIKSLSSSSFHESNERITILCYMDVELDENTRQKIMKSCAQFLAFIQTTTFSEDELKTHGFRLPQTSDENVLVVEFGNVKTQTGPSFQLIFGTPKRLGLDVKDSLFLKFNSPETIQPVSVEGISTWQAIFDCELHVSHIPDLDAIDTNGVIKILIGLTLQDTYMPWDKSHGLQVLLGKITHLYSSLENFCSALTQSLPNQERLPLTFLISQYLKVGLRKRFWTSMLKNYSSKISFFQCIQELMIQNEIPIETINALLHHAALIHLQEPSEKLEAHTGIQVFREKEARKWKIVYRIDNYSLKLPIYTQEATRKLLKASPDQLQHLKVLWEMLVPADYTRSVGVSPFLETANLIPELPKHMEAAAIQLLEQADPFLQFLGFRVGIAALNLKNSVILKTAILSKIPFLLDNCDQKATIFHEACALFDLPNKTIPENASMKELQWMWVECLCDYTIDFGHAVRAWQKLLPNLSQDEIQKYFLHLHAVFFPIVGSSFLISFFSYLTPATCTQAIQTLIAAQRLDKQSLAEMIEKHLLPQNNQKLLETCLTQLRALSGFSEAAQVLSQAKDLPKEFISSQTRQTFEETFRVSGKETALSIWLQPFFQPMLQEADKKVCLELLQKTEDKLVSTVLKRPSDDEVKLELFKNFCSQNKHAEVQSTLSNAKFIPLDSAEYATYKQEALTYFDAFCKSSPKDPLWQMDFILKLMKTDALASACREEPRLMTIIQLFLNLKKPAGKRSAQALGSYGKLASDLQTIVTEEVSKQSSLSLTSAWVELVKREIVVLDMRPEGQVVVYERLKQNKRVETLFDLLTLSKYQHHLIDQTILPIYLWTFKEMLTQQPALWQRVQTAMTACRKNKTLRTKPHVQDWLSLHLTILPHLEKPHDWLVVIKGSIIDQAPVEELPQLILLLQKSVLELPFEHAYLLFKKIHSKLQEPVQTCLKMLNKRYTDSKNLIPCADFLQKEAAMLTALNQQELMPFVNEKVKLLLELNNISLEIPLKIMGLYQIKEMDLWLTLLEKLHLSSSTTLQQLACQEWKKCTSEVSPGTSKENCWLFAIECGIRSESDAFLTEALNRSWVKSIFPQSEQQFKFYELLLTLIPQFPKSKALDWNLFRKLRSWCEGEKEVQQALSSEVFFTSLCALLQHHSQTEDIDQAIFQVEKICAEGIAENEERLKQLIFALLDATNQDVHQKISTLILQLVPSQTHTLKTAVKQKLMQSQKPLIIQLATNWIYDEFSETKQLNLEETLPVFKQHLTHQDLISIQITDRFLLIPEFRTCLPADLFQEFRMQSLVSMLSLQKTEAQINKAITHFNAYFPEVHSHFNALTCIRLGVQNLFLLLFKYQDCNNFAILQKAFFAHLKSEECVLYKTVYTEPTDEPTEDLPFIFSTCLTYLKVMIDDDFPKETLVGYLQQLASFCIRHTSIIDSTRAAQAYSVVQHAYQKKVFKDSTPVFLKCYLMLGRLLPAQLDLQSEGQVIFKSEKSGVNLFLHGFPSEEAEMKMILLKAQQSLTNQTSNIFIETAQDLVEVATMHAMWKASVLMITVKFAFNTTTISELLIKILNHFKSSPESMWDVYPISNQFFFQAFIQAFVQSAFFQSKASKKDKNWVHTFTHQLLEVMLQKSELHADFEKHLCIYVCLILQNSKGWGEYTRQQEKLVENILTQLSDSLLISKKNLLLILEESIKSGIIKQNSNFYKKKRSQLL